MRAWLHAACVAIALAWTSPVAGQDDRITPPEPVEIDRAAYPDGGVGDATVLLELVVGEDGRVKSVAVVRGREPFAGAAREAAASWRFTPASRRGEAVAAKIRYELAFEETVRIDPDPDVESAAEPADDSPNRADTAPDVFEVAAEEVAQPPSVSSLRRSEIRRLPGAFGDPFRAIEVLPGVTPIVSGLPFFYVRGAPPGNVGYFLDGVRVPYLFHVAAGPSVVHPAIVERVDLYSGGYPARFGRYAGAIVSAETTEPRADWHGEGKIRIVDAGALVEGGFLDGRGRALIAGRYSYTAALFSLLSPEITLDYRDFQGRFSFDITERDRISVFSFGSYDYLSDTSPDGVETVLFGSEFYRVDTRYDARLHSGGALRAAVTAGFDRTRVADGRNTRSVLVNTRVRLSEPITKNLTLRAGFDMQLDDYRADERQYTDPDDPDTAAYNALFPPRSDSAAATWADVVWRLSPQLEVTPGVRVDGYYSNGAKAVAADPRLAVTARVHERVR
ncbi:MAG: TonB-dependent receptor plug domain-containing protein, partial [Polyangiaceae bacterium]